MERRTFIQLMGTGALAIGAGSTLSACKSKSDGNIRPYMRFLNLAPDQSSLNVSLSVSSSYGALAFQGNTGYQQIDWASSYTVTVKDGSGAVLNTFGASANQNSHVTAIFYRGPTGVIMTGYQDDKPTIASGQFVIRTVLAATSVGPYDLYITGVNDAVSTATVIGTTAGGVTAYASTTYASSGVNLASGTSYRVRVFASGNKTTPLYDSTMTFDAAAYTLIFYTLGSANLPTMLLTKADSDTVQVLSNANARINVLQGAAPATSGAGSSIAIDGKDVFANVPLGANSGYTTQPAGNHTVTLGMNGGTYATVTNNFAAGRDYTVFFAGTQGVASAFVLEESDLPMTVGQARVRFVNATSDQSVKVQLGYTVNNTILAPGNSTTPAEVAPQTTSVTFVNSSTGAVLYAFTANSLSIVAGNCYEIVLSGGNGTYTGTMFQSNTTA